MSISTEITRLNTNINNLKQTKQDIKNAVNNDFTEITNEQIENYAQKIKDTFELYKDQIPFTETEKATEIAVNDAMVYSKNELKLFGNTEQATRILPEGYTQLNYIESTGTQYIDTGIKANGLTTNFDIKFSQSAHSNYNFLFSARESSSSKRFDIGWSSGGRTWFAYYNRDIASQTLTTNTDYIIKKEGADIYLNENILYTIQNLIDFETPVNEVIFANNTNGTISNYGKLKLYYFKIYNGTTLIRDYIPCKNTDNEIGLYDLISQTFFGNDGTGDFVAGNEITIPNPDYPQNIHIVTGDNTIHVNNIDYSLNLGLLELCKIGNYQDYIYKDNGNWYKYGAVKKIILNGTEEGWRQSGVASCVHNIPLADILPTTSNSQIYINGISDKFLNGVSYNNITTGEYQRYYNRMSATNDGYLSFSYETTTTTASWKEWLTTNNVIAYYVVATPTPVQITDETLISQLEAIYNHLQTIKGINNIAVTASDLAPYMKLSYKKLEINENSL